MITPTNKVALINMPFSAASRPALGISLLQAGLRRNGFECDLYYFNLSFAARVGADDYSHVAYGLIEESLAGEWVFRDTLFAPATGEAANYLKDILLGKFAKHFPFRVVLSLLKMRAAAAEYLQACLNSQDWSQYRIVGFTTTFQQNVASLALAKKIKELHPEVLIALGGGNCEGEMGITLHRQFPFIDFVCSGEGDLNFPEVAARVIAGRPLGDLDGIITRNAAGETVVPKQMVCPVELMDWLPVPSFDDYFSQLRAAGLEGKVEPVVPVETSRGCWWGAKNHCTFCGLNGSTMSFRSKSATRALEEIEELGRYGKEFLVVDNIMDLKYLESVIPALAERNSGHKFHYETKVNLRKRHLRLLAEAGVSNLQPGIESLSTSVLKLMRKGCTFLQNVQFLKWSRQYGITCIWNFLYGFPGEDPAEYARAAEQIPSLVHFRPPEVCTAVRFDRFSPYFMEPESFGIRNRASHYAYRYIYPFDEDTLEPLAYYFNYDFNAKSSVENYAKPAVDAIACWQNHEGEAKLEAVLDQHGLPSGDLSSEDLYFDLLIADTRPAASAASYRLRGIERDIYLFCDEARSLTSMQKRFPELAPDALQDFLARWIAQRLMVSEGNQYLALAVLQFDLPEVGLSPGADVRRKLTIIGQSVSA